MTKINSTRINNVSNKSLDNLFGELVSSIDSPSVYCYTDIDALLRGCRLILRILYLLSRVCLPRLPSSAYFRSFIVILVDSCLVRA